MIAIMESLATGLTPTPPLTTCVFHLGQNPVSPSVDTSLGSLTECTFDGYAPVTIASWSTPAQNLQGDTVVTPTTIPSFSCSGSVSVNNVQSAYITGPGTVASLLAVATLAPFTPIPTQAFRITPQVGLAGGLNVCEC